MSRKRIGFIKFMNVQIEQLKSANRFGTAKNYQKCLKSFSTFLKGRDVAVSAVNKELIWQYNTYLINKGLVKNSISFYMRILRTVYNQAVKQKLVTQSHPFADVYTGIDQTRKRAVPETVVKELKNLNLDNNPELSLARDLFIFSYCCRGMSFVDVAFLKKNDIKDGVICYKRKKTGQLMMVKIEPCIKAIMERYNSNSSIYVFPILKSVEYCNAFREYQSAINIYNRNLRRLSVMLRLESKLTSYTARHSWATAARKHNIPISVISAGMGHTSEQTTRIYLAMLENIVIDNANQTILNGLGV